MKPSFSKVLRDLMYGADDPVKFCIKCEHYRCNDYCGLGAIRKPNPIEPEYEYPNRCSVLNAHNNCPHHSHRSSWD